MTDAADVSEKPTILEVQSTQRSPDYRSLYANNTKFGVSAFDFSMIFGEIMEAVEGTLYIEQKVKVVMTPLHAKIFALILDQNIRNFETQFGEIKLPASGVTAIPATPVTENEAKP